ncbi:hypothetical protein DRF65_20780 [Chryseobacterium pennae]|jgi:hypothetical protein|uniref:Uncharacterized protein n=1 Tax=Chryseobacterium pennae TaxID=2258962 RepID=A0A3D9C4U5_9FLAO|nr:hypothetical protein [Chryseobacterium pennae]REC60501.1 hypothetical protein DRF65_20780 [Chryseobacterium pennae]
MKKLAIKTQNKAGNEPKYKENLGLVSIFINSEAWISIDLFEGFGDSYKQREIEEIVISDNGNIVFKGSFGELIQILKPIL